MFGCPDPTAFFADCVALSCAPTAFYGRPFAGGTPLENELHTAMGLTFDAAPSCVYGRGAKAPVLEPTRPMVAALRRAERDWAQ